MRSTNLILIIVALAAGLSVGWWLRGTPLTGTSENGVGEAAVGPNAQASPSSTKAYACAMNCVEPMREPGDCPVCGMELTAVSAQSKQAHLLQGISDQVNAQRGNVTLSPEAAARARIKLHTVKRSFMPVRTRLLGVIRVDGQRIVDVTSWVSGRVESLFDSRVGRTVAKGQALIAVDTPLLEYARTEIETLVREEALQPLPQRVEAVRERLSLRLWGIEPSQLQAIVENRTVPDYLDFQSPIDGVVLTMHVSKGAQVTERSPLVTVADLQQVIGEFQADIPQLNWLREGQQVIVTSDHHQATKINARLDRIDATLSNDGFARIEVTLLNPEGRLRPGMPVTAEVRSLRTQDGQVVEPDRSKRTDAHEQVKRPIVIPASAPLLTGKRAVVYVAAEGHEPTYTLREIVLGPRAGDFFIVERGLSEGEQVVAHGAMTIDGEAQLTTGSGMVRQMQQRSLAADRKQARPTNWPQLVDSYLAIQDNLAHDRLSGAVEEGTRLYNSVTPDASLVTRNLAGSARRLGKATDIDLARKEFESLSILMIEAVSDFGTGRHPVLYRAHCPMAFDDKGADWIQKEKAITNPYFGASMYRCGLIKNTIQSSEAVSPSE